MYVFRHIKNGGFYETCLLCYLSTPGRGIATRLAMDSCLAPKPLYAGGRSTELGAAGMDDIDYGTGMLAGPIVSLLLSPDLTFSLAGLAGRQSTHWQSKFSDYSAAQEVSGGYYFDALRVDIDSALSYRLSDNFKVFAGYKLLYLSTDYKYTEVR